jgi:hypothetical protein
VPPQALPLGCQTPVHVRLPDWKRVCARLRIAQASMSISTYDRTKRCGSVLWAASVQEAEVWLSWAWHEVKRNVIAMDNPLAVMSNVAIIDAAGAEISQENRILHLHAALYRLPWQSAVLDFVAIEPENSIAA